MQPTENRPCRLVVIDARKAGTKVLLAISAVDRESELSSPDVLPDLKRWGIKAPPKTGGR